MADLDFSHNVQQIPAGADLPKPVQRQVSAETSGVPDYQSALNNYGSETNWMSAVGSQVASRASNEIASRIGGELGKNPQGNIGTPLTDFDKTMQDSYSTQAEATLGIQAQTLITKSNLELAAVPRLSTGLIAKSQDQVYTGLQKIYSLAPNSIRPSLEHQYDSIMLNQYQSLNTRMISDQKDDRRNNTDLAVKLNTQNAHSLAVSGIGLDKNGDSSPGLSAVKSVERSMAAAVAIGDKTPVEAKVAVDAARQAYLTGKKTREALDAEKNGKLPEYYKSLADDKTLKDQDRIPVINGVQEYMNLQASLKLQDQQLKISQAQVKLAEDPASLASQLAQLQNELTPIQFQKLKLDFVQAINKKRNDNIASTYLITNWANPEAQARSSEDNQKKGYYTLVNKLVNNTQPGTVPLTQDMAEVQVAASAGAPVKVFTKTLQNKLSSGNPIQMESAAQQIEQLQQMGAGHALDGLTEKDKAAFGAYESLRNSLQPTEAAREVIDKIYNQDPAVYTANQQKWSNYLYQNTIKSSQSTTDFALKQFGYSAGDFLNPSVAQVYGTDMLNKYSTYYQLLNGDQVTAQRVTQRYIDQNYGETSVNGGSNTTLHPLEKVLGYKSNDVTPFIQQDVIDKLNQHFKPIKDAYDKKQTNEYWETLPLTSKQALAYIGLAPSNKPIQVKRYTRVGNKEETKVFDVVVQGNSFDNWDISVNSDSGLRNLYQIAPYLGVIKYVPNKKSIDDNYLKHQ